MSSIFKICLKENEYVESNVKDLLGEFMKNYDLFPINLTETSSESHDYKKDSLHSLSSSFKNYNFKESEDQIILRKLNSEIFLMDKNIHQLEFNKKLKLITVR